MKTKSEVFQIAKEMGWENPGPGIKRQIMGYDGQLMMVKVVFEEGAVGTMHEHYHSQATYVASGKFDTPCYRFDTNLEDLRSLFLSKKVLPSYYNFAVVKQDRFGQLVLLSERKHKRL